MKTDSEIVESVKRELESIKKESMQLYYLHDDWPNKKEWQNKLLVLRQKQYLLEQILGIE
jgi:hypothetical protein